MPRVSVVVPVYQVESYLATCLQSLARQTFGDLEVVMVDDGSTDRSVAIAEHFVDRDPRFRLLHQPNGGLGKARNTGLADASGEFVAFVDSDDVVRDGAYARMVRALDDSGSDFATGNVQRLTHEGASQARFLAATFGRTRMRTHVTEFRPLLADRTAWNKLWRRTFWDEHAGRFPEGVVHEDIPVTLPAHLAAGRVDVLAQPVYQYRIREEGGQSITQGRLEHRVLRDRLAAIEQVRSYFAEHGSRKLCRWYDESLLADDLRRHLTLLDDGDSEYRAMFFEGARRILGDSPRRLLHGLSAIDRLKWHLVARGAEDELLQVLRFEHEQRDDTPPVRRHGRFYGDYPFRTDRRRLGIPRSAYRLGRRDDELTLTAHLDDLEADREVLRLRGRAYIPVDEAAGPRAQRTTALALSPGRWQALRLRTVATRLPTRGLERSGFEAKVDPSALLGRRGWRDGRWKLFLSTRAGTVRRRRGQFQVESPELIGAVDLRAPAGCLARATVSTEGAVTVEVRGSRWARLESCPRVVGDHIELAIEFGAASGPASMLRLKRRSDALDLTYPLDPDGRARIPLDDLHGAPASLEASAPGAERADEIWDLWAEGSRSPLAVAVPEGMAGVEWHSGPNGLLLIRTRRGDAAFVTRPAAGVERGDGAETLRRVLALERTTAPASGGLARQSRACASRLSPVSAIESATGRGCQPRRSRALALE